MQFTAHATGTFQAHVASTWALQHLEAAIHHLAQGNDFIALLPGAPRSHLSDIYGPSALSRPQGY